MTGADIFEVLRGRPYYSMFAMAILAVLLVSRFIMPTDGPVWSVLANTLASIYPFLFIGFIVAFLITAYAWTCHISAWRQERAERVVQEQEANKQARETEKRRAHLQGVLDGLKAASPTEKTFKTLDSIEKWSGAVVPLLDRNKSYQTQFINQIGIMYAKPSQIMGNQAIHNVKSIWAAAVGDIEIELRTIQEAPQSPPNPKRDR